MVDLPLDLTGSFTLLVVRDDVGVWNLTVKVIRDVVGVWNLAVKVIRVIIVQLLEQIGGKIDSHCA